MLPRKNFQIKTVKEFIKNPRKVQPYSFDLGKKHYATMVVTQKITRPTAILSKHDSKCEEMREWIFIANYTLPNFRSQAFKT